MRCWRTVYGSCAGSCLQVLDTRIPQQGSHLSDSDLIKLQKALWYRKPLSDQYGVEAFEIGKDHELFKRGMVANVAISIRMIRAPLPCCLTEQRDIQNIGFSSIGDSGLSLRQHRWDECVPDCVRMNSIVDLG